MSARHAHATVTAHPGQWIVLIPREDGEATVLTVESDERSALAWRAELVRRIAADLTRAHQVLTTTDGRVLISSDAPVVTAGPQRGGSIQGPRELLVVRVETPLPPLRRADAALHRLLAGSFSG